MNVAKYVLAGFIFWLVGGLFVGSSMGFNARSEPVQLVVVGLDTKLNTDRETMYRPVLRLANTSASRSTYVGNHWTRPAPHAVGDEVAGRYDADSGEMRTDKMNNRSMWIGWVVHILGYLIWLQAFALVLGVPESRLPLKVRFRSRRRRRRFAIQGLR